MKNTIATLFALLAMASFLLLFIGFFSPRKALFWYGKPRTKKTSALIYGFMFLASVVIFGQFSPKTPDSGEPADQAAANTTTAATTSDTKTAATADNADEPVQYEVAETSREGDGVYLKLVINKIYTRPALIEATRKLKEQYQANGKFSCYYYYKKYTRLMTATAGLCYLNDCSQCEYQDKDGTKVDFPCYNLSKSAADSLKALSFDTAGFKTEVIYMDPIGNMRKYILSTTSPSGKALLVEQAVDFHMVTPLVRIKKDGQDRFCEADDRNKYFLIDKDGGLVDHYSYGELDDQDVIDQ